jgi:hypothetical protein
MVNITIVSGRATISEIYTAALQAENPNQKGIKMSLCRAEKESKQVQN